MIESLNTTWEDGDISLSQTHKYAINFEPQDQTPPKSMTINNAPYFFQTLKSKLPLNTNFTIIFIFLALI